MKNVIYFSLLCVCLLCSSCNINRSATSNQNQIQTQVVLEKNNYRVIGSVRGESHQTYVLGIGGLSKESLGRDAMQNMFENADLIGKPRAVINVNVCYKNSFYVLVSKRIAIATGTLIEYID